MSVDHYTEALRHLAEADAHVAATHRHRSCQLSALTHALLKIAVRLGACPQTAPAGGSGTPQPPAGAPSQEDHS